MDVPVLQLARLEPLIGELRYADLVAESARTVAALGGCTVWNVNSTATGGGVAEMLQVLVGYIQGVGVSARWIVIQGDPQFFSVTKRMHNNLHGAAGDGGGLGPRETAVYEAVTAANAAAFVEQVRSGDVVILHDPQTAGLSRSLKSAGATVVWRCHIGSDITNAWTEEGWEFLRPYLSACDGFVFSRQVYVPEWIPSDRVRIIPPSIDPFSPKNQELSSESQRGILSAIGVLEGVQTGAPSFVCRDGSTGYVTRRASIIAAAPLDPLAPLVIQVSRWDHLKDMAGVMAGFATHLAGRGDAHLALIGPAVDDVSDDPEERVVLEECVEAWSALTLAERRRIRLVSLPMDDIDENGAMVNALQRHATVIVQKSLAEGFGLTVAEGMWKSKAVVASAVGGIIDQVTPETGVLLDDPGDLDQFGDALVVLLSRPAEIERLGVNARRHVLEHFLGDHHLMQYGLMIEQLKRC